MTNDVYDKNLSFTMKNLKNLFFINNLIILILAFMLSFLISFFKHILINGFKIYNKEIIIDWSQLIIYKEMIVIILFFIFLVFTLRSLFYYIKDSYNILEDLQDIDNNIEVSKNVLLIPTKEKFKYLVMNKEDTLKTPKKLTSLICLNKDFLNKNSNIVYFKHTKTIIYLESNK